MAGFIGKLFAKLREQLTVVITGAVIAVLSIFLFEPLRDAWRESRLSLVQVSDTDGQIVTLRNDGIELQAVQLKLVAYNAAQLEVVASLITSGLPVPALRESASGLLDQNSAVLWPIGDAVFRVGTVDPAKPLNLPRHEGMRAEVIGCRSPVDAFFTARDFGTVSAAQLEARRTERLIVTLVLLLAIAAAVVLVVVRYVQNRAAGNSLEQVREWYRWFSLHRDEFFERYYGEAKLVCAGAGHWLSDAEREAFIHASLERTLALGRSLTHANIPFKVLLRTAADQVLAERFARRAG